MLTEFEAEIRPLVTSLRAALTEVMGSQNNDTLSHFLSTAPFDTCVRLADTWALAESIGIPTSIAKARFGPEDQFLIDMVTSVYTAARPGSHSFDLRELAHLLDETADDFTTMA